MSKALSVDLRTRFLTAVAEVPAAKWRQHASASARPELADGVRWRAGRATRGPVRWAATTAPVGSRRRPGDDSVDSGPHFGCFAAS